MKKTAIFLVFFCLGVVFNGFSQATPPNDFFAGKWQLSILGTPNGDVTFNTDLVRKEGKLTGELVNAATPDAGKLAITKVEENGDLMSIYFESPEYGELSIDLKKVDDENLKGSIAGLEASAKRIK